MKMKNLICMVMMSMVASNGYAQNPPETQPGSGSGTSTQPQNRLSEAQACGQKIDEAESLAKVVSGKDASATPAQITAAKSKIEMSKTEVKRCRTLEMAAQSIGNAMENGGGQVSTVDKRATCYSKAGYTLDYNSCTGTKEIYNYIVGLEKLMLSSQTSRLQKKEEAISATATTQTINGDGQNAAYDASVADNNFKSSLSMEQAEAYSAAVVALGAKITSWQGSSPSALSKLCSKTSIPTKDVDKLIQANCQADLPNLKGNQAVFANNEAKGAFVMAAMEFGAKAAAAMIAAKKFKAVAQAVASAAAANDTTTTALANCVTNPTSAECITTSTTANGQTFSSGDFSLGDGAGTNSLGGTTNGSDFGETGDASTLGGNTVAGVTDPFANNQVGCTNNKNSTDANKAACILNPAAAANVSPTGGASGGGGGGAGGLGGGGASLGSDLAGAKGDDKTADIKSGKASAAYTSGGGQAFRGVASSKDDANPFASMFDSKNGGGVEEDGSISADIAGQDSGLFQKISKRYTQIQSEKRIEANNLE
jgi:hypothetical protein